MDETQLRLDGNAARDGRPRWGAVGIATMIEWIAEWIRSDRPMLGKPTHFEERTGKF